MIEMRIVEIDGCRPEFQYRHHLFATDASGALHPHIIRIWSEWKTAPYVNLMETQNA